MASQTLYIRMRSRKQKLLSKKLHDYQNGKLSLPERTVIDKWFDGKLIDAHREAHESNIQDEGRANELFAAIKQAIEPEQKRSWRSTTWLKVACTILVLSGLTLLYNKQQSNETAKNQITWQTYSTAKGEVKKITLPDGTLIWMNAATQIRVNTDFKTSKARKLQMDFGEAFFQVQRDTLRPFSISTGHLLTTVLGTSFNIKSYPELKSYKVAVATGKVKVTYEDGNRRSVLSSGLVKDQILNFNLLTQKTKIKLQNVSEVTQWKSNRSLFFDELTLDQIAAELARQYNIVVKVSGLKKQTRTYTMQLDYQDLNATLQQIVLRTGISYQLANKVLTLKPGI